ncbi:DUF3240 family protein [Comamonas terrigena]|jgi:hypothetical protein|uniref:DUF3240 family protein n=1 Tax=Comamonas terrigena TaxID=32013 RepID=UPI00244C7ECC|nr:DUF3240 family protein [Comamonas terrigena]MDH0051380.1 DUF3240 family protein [Comamonas terrigena]MDH0513792.1 DUF3240 family protein [Comamonas terrigena]MDH1093329.1 DUF3240 family protein [Comamonas terrigena]MDH1502918.1 DUF3240 family protein [Comamonas terrigena]
MPKHCLSLVCSPDIAEKLLDSLLISLPEQVFTSTFTFSHGTPHGRLSGAEKVMGRSNSMQIQLIVEEDQLHSTLAMARRDFKGTGLYFWAYELSAEGVIE